MTKGSAEERIVQTGREKMALDQALIESIDIEDAAEVDVESILKHGAKLLFDEEDNSKVIKYTPTSVDELLDQTIAVAKTNKIEKGARSQLSVARIWVNDEGTLTDDIGDADAESPTPEAEYWDKALGQRNAAAAAEALKNKEKLGRGGIKRNAAKQVDYTGKGTPALEGDGEDEEPSAVKKGRKKRARENSESEGEYDAVEVEASDDESVGGMPEDDENYDLQAPQQGERSRSKFLNQGTTGKPLTKSFPNPPTPTPSGNKTRVNALSLNFSAKPAKVQQRVQSLKSTANKVAAGAKPQPIMGTAEKQPNIPFMRESTGTMQQAQINGRAAVSNCSEPPVDTNAPDKMQQAQINGLSVRPVGVDMNSIGVKQLAHLNSLLAKQPSTAKQNANNGTVLRKQVANISGHPAKPNGRKPRLQSIAKAAPAAVSSVKTALSSSDERSQLSSETRNAAFEHESSEANNRKKANTTSVQLPQERTPSQDHQELLPPAQDLKDVLPLQDHQEMLPAQDRQELLYHLPQHPLTRSSQTMQYLICPTKIMQEHLDIPRIEPCHNPHLSLPVHHIRPSCYPSDHNRIAANINRHTPPLLARSLDLQASRPTQISFSPQTPTTNLQTTTDPLTSSLRSLSQDTSAGSPTKPQTKHMATIMRCPMGLELHADPKLALSNIPSTRSLPPPRFTQSIPPPYTANSPGMLQTALHNHLPPPREHPPATATASQMDLDLDKNADADRKLLKSMVHHTKAAQALPHNLPTSHKQCISQAQLPYFSMATETDILKAHMVKNANLDRRFLMSMVHSTIPMEVNAVKAKMPSVQVVPKT
jgi:hypothetical protein